MPVMQIRWQEMEPQFAGRVRARLCTMTPAPERLSPVWQMFAWIISAMFLAAYVGISFNTTGAAGLVGLSCMPLVLMGIALTPAYLTARRNPNSPRHTLPRQIPPDLFEKAVRAAPTNVAEVLYGEILVRLHDGGVLTNEQRVLLRQCTALLKQHRLLTRFINEYSANKRKATSFTTGNCLGGGRQIDVFSHLLIHSPEDLKECQEVLCAALDTAWQVLAHKKATAPLLAAPHTHREIETLMQTLRPIAAREQENVVSRTS